jgi:hypothetical protein
VPHAGTIRFEYNPAMHMTDINLILSNAQLRKQSKKRRYGISNGYKSVRNLKI